MAEDGQLVWSEGEIFNCVGTYVYMTSTQVNSLKLKLNYNNKYLKVKIRNHSQKCQKPNQRPRVKLIYLSSIKYSLFSINHWQRQEIIWKYVSKIPIQNWRISTSPERNQKCRIIFRVPKNESCFSDKLIVKEYRYRLCR